MSELIGKLNIPTKIATYEGEITSTAEVTVNNATNNKTISVDVNVEEVTKNCASKEDTVIKYVTIPNDYEGGYINLTPEEQEILSDDKNCIIWKGIVLKLAQKAGSAVKIYRADFWNRDSDYAHLIATYFIPNGRITGTVEATQSLVTTDTDQDITGFKNFTQGVKLGTPKHSNYEAKIVPNDNNRGLNFFVGEEDSNHNPQHSFQIYYDSNGTDIISRGHFTIRGMDDIEESYGRPSHPEIPNTCTTYLFNTGIFAEDRVDEENVYTYLFPAKDGIFATTDDCGTKLYKHEIITDDNHDRIVVISTRQSAYTGDIDLSVGENGVIQMKMGSLLTRLAIDSTGTLIYDYNNSPYYPRTDTSYTDTVTAL